MAIMIAFMMTEINAKASVEGCNFVIQYILQEGLKIFRDKGLEASKKEIRQLYKRTCFTPINVSTITPSERRKPLKLYFSYARREMEESREEWYTMATLQESGCCKMRLLVLQWLVRVRFSQASLMLKKKETP